MFLTLLHFLTITALTSAGVNDCKGLIVAQGVSKADQRLILSLHNNVRGAISKGTFPHHPKSRTPLPPLTWDERLARSADVQASSCRPGTYPYPFRGLFPLKSVAPQDSVGQNFELIFSNLTKSKDGGDNSTWTSVINKWLAENKHYEFGKKPDKRNRKYVQMVWAESTRIGCGYTHFSIGEIGQEQSKLYICNYWYRGNVRGENPYEKATK